MKILVIGLDCAAPEILLEDERLTNIRHLMSVGCYGRLESVVPPITVPAWMCMATSQDPGSLGVYGFRNRVDRSYSGLRVVDSKAFRELTIWDQIARQGGRTNIVGAPPNYPPRRINGVSIGCFLTPSEEGTSFVEPRTMQSELTARFGEYVVDVAGFRTEDKPRLRDQIYAMTRTHFEVVRYLMTHTEWDYFQFVEIGLDRMHHGFWKHHDPSHVLHPTGSPFADTIRDYYEYLDDELGRVLQCLTEETIVCVLSDHGAQRLDGGFCINQWLVDQGWLVLRQRPDKITPFAELDVDWKRTRVWSEGGYCARVFLNVQGREPDGAVAPAEYERFRDEVKTRLEATTDANGKRLGTLVFKPEEIYRRVRGFAPDLLVHFGGLYWRSVGGVGYPSWHVVENDTGPDDCNHAQFGAFVLAAANLPAQGKLERAHLLDVAPTLLSLGGYEVADSMQGGLVFDREGRPLGRTPPDAGDESSAPASSTIDRLRGLGYLG